MVTLADPHSAAAQAVAARRPHPSRARRAPSLSSPPDLTIWQVPEATVPAKDTLPPALYCRRF